ncbi:MAG: PTS fructose transporter subunit IIA [Anaerorhabdus sp.]
MRGILLISHGFYAEAFKESLKMIAGNVENLYACCLEPTDGPEEFKAKLQAVEPTLDGYDSVLVFADLFGGSPCNTACQYFVTKEKYSFIAGMNFPMVLNALLSEDSDLESVISQGRESIVDVRAFMQAMMSSDEDE